MADLFDGLGAGAADGGEAGVGAGVGCVLPAALALLAGGAFHLDSQGVGVAESDFGDDEQGGQFAGVLLEQRVEIAIGRETYASFERSMSFRVSRKSIDRPTSFDHMTTWSRQNAVGSG